MKGVRGTSRITCVSHLFKICNRLATGTNAKTTSTAQSMADTPESASAVPKDATGDVATAEPPAETPADTEVVPPVDDVVPDGLPPVEQSKPIDPDHAAILLRISNAFKVFDTENNSTVDVR